MKYKEVENEQMEEVVLGTMALQRGLFEMDIIAFPENEERVQKNMNLIRKIDERWAILRTVEADVKKRHLISYAEWLILEKRVKELPSEEQDGLTRWNVRGNRPNGEKWKWLKELDFSPAQGPVRAITDEPGLGNLGHEAESIPGEEIEEGWTERDVDMLNRGKDQSSR